MVCFEASYHFLRLLHSYFFLPGFMRLFCFYRFECFSIFKVKEKTDNAAVTLLSLTCGFAMTGAQPLQFKVILILALLCISTDAYTSLL